MHAASLPRTSVTDSMSIPHRCSASIPYPIDCIPLQGWVIYRASWFDIMIAIAVGLCKVITGSSRVEAWCAFLGQFSIKRICTYWWIWKRGHGMQNQIVERQTQTTGCHVTLRRSMLRENGRWKMVKRDVNQALTPLRSSIVMACGRTVTANMKR